MLHKKCSGLFSEIIVAPSNDGETSLVILIGEAREATLFDDVMMAIQTLDKTETVDELWLPMFKHSASATTGAISELHAGSTSYTQAIEMQLFSMPRSDGTPVVEPSEGAIVVDRPFVVAVTHN